MAITDLDEQLLVRAHQAGDDAAFGKIVRSQHRALYAHAFRRLGDHEAAEDAVQDTLLRAYRAMPSFDGDLRLRAWLHRILTNVCYDEGNRRRREAGLIEKLEREPMELADDPAEEAMVHDVVRLMGEALADLPERYREALVLRYVDGLSFREVADATGISEENARARVHRGRVALNKILSRIAVLAAFLIPGLRRTQPGAEPAVGGAAAADPGVAFATQLASHAAQAAPAVSRMAELSSAMPGGKAALVGTAVAAVAAMAVPTAVVVREVSRPEPRAALTAAPAEDDDDQVSTAAAPSTSVVDPATEPTSTTSVEPPSAAMPFEGTPPETESPSTTSAPESTTTSTTSTTTPPAEPRMTGGVDASRVTVDGVGPNFDLAGSVGLSGARSATGQLTGRLSIHDDGSVVGELVLTVDGVAHELRFRGTRSESAEGDAAGTTTFTGQFRLTDGAALGLPGEGDVVSGTFNHDGGAGSLGLRLEGPPA